MVKFDGANKNDLISAVIYATVIDRHKVNGRAIDCKNVDNGEEFSFLVQGSSSIEEMYSADWFDITRKVTRTEMAETLSHSFNIPFTVVFEKLDGSTRKLRGRLIEPEILMGRCKVEDLDKPAGKRMRLVDNRTLIELIVRGVKYTLKK